MKKILSILLSFCILMAHFGCSTFKTVPLDQASMSVSKKNSLVIHGIRTRYQLYDYQFTEAGLEGQLKRYEGDNLNTLHVFTNMRFSLPGNSTDVMPVLIPNAKIQKVKYAEHSTLKSILLVGGLIFLCGFISSQNISYGLSDL